MQLSDEDSADLTAHSATIAQPTGGISTNVPSEILATEPLPVAFLVDEADSAEFSAEEDRIILAVQSQFVNELGEITDNSAITDPVYRAEWNRARWNADNQLRLELGGVGFNQFNSLAAQGAETQSASE